MPPDVVPLRVASNRQRATVGSIIGWYEMIGGACGVVFLC